MGKIPSIQLYTGDWMKDPALRSVSSSARGLWIDMLCLMFEAPRRGFLELSEGVPVTDKQLGRMTGVNLKEVRTRLQELLSAAVFSVSPEGVIYCRRMVRDEDKRLRDKENGKLGGNPKLKGGDNPPGLVSIQPKSTPSSSSSSSSSTSVLNTPLPPKGGKAFRPPTLDEVKAYCLERGNRVDPETFRDFYEAKGWKVGAQPMKDWKAAVRTWEKSEEKRGGGRILTFKGLEGDFHDASL